MGICYILEETARPFPSLVVLFEALISSVVPALLSHTDPRVHVFNSGGCVVESSVI